jgi:hypothetical protein
VTFTTSVHNWPIFIITLKELYDNYIWNCKFKNDESLDIKEFIKNDPITCTCYYEHKMNSFRKLIRNTNLIFSQVKDYFFHIWISIKKFTLWSWIIMDKKWSKIWWFSKWKFECFVDKYLAIDQTMLKHEICNMQIHQHKWMCRKKSQAICQFQYLKQPMKHTKISSPLAKENCISKYHDISIKIYI